MEVLRNLLGRGRLWEVRGKGSGVRWESFRPQHVMSVMREEEGKQAREESDTSAFGDVPARLVARAAGGGRARACLTAVGARALQPGPLSAASGPAGASRRDSGRRPFQQVLPGCPPPRRRASVGRRVEGLPGFIVSSAFSLWSRAVSQLAKGWRLPVGSLYSPLSARGAEIREGS